MNDPFDPKSRFPLDDPIPTYQIALLQELPLKPVCEPILGRFVTMEPYDTAHPDEHLPSLYAALNGTPYLHHPAYDPELLVWRYLWGFPSTIDELGTRLHKLRDGNDCCLWIVRLNTTESDTNTTATILNDFVPPTTTSSSTVTSGISSTDKNDASNRIRGPIIGTMAYIANRPDNLCLEIAYVLFTPAVQGTPVATECTSLLLDRAFSLGYRRIEWKTNVRNERSRNAALRLGFTFEGIFRHHMIVQENRNRDTAWYSMLREEYYGSHSGAIVEEKEEEQKDLRKDIPIPVPNDKKYNEINVSTMDTISNGLSSSVDTDIQQDTNIPSIDPDTRRILGSSSTINSSTQSLPVRQKLQTWLTSEQATDLFRKRITVLRQLK